MWVKLSSQHAAKADDTIHQRWQELYDYKYDPENNVTSYINGILSIANQLKEMNKPIPERQILNKILAALPPSLGWCDLHKRCFQPMKEQSTISLEDWWRKKKSLRSNSQTVAPENAERTLWKKQCCPCRNLYYSKYHSLVANQYFNKAL
jgi:hypothetical protein